MIYTLRTGYNKRVLQIPIVAIEDTDVYTIVRDIDFPETILTRRVDYYNKGENIPVMVQMPLTGRGIIVEVFENEFMPDAMPTTFSIGALQLLPLMTHMALARYGDRFFEEWFEFRGQFAFNAKWLPVNEGDKVYQSSLGNFQIRYVDMIVDENGVEDVTPMNRNKYTGIINVSKKKLMEMDMTVPGICCALDHEYAHMNRNKIPASEVEADLNGLTISLASGSPRYECKEIYYSIIYNVDSEENLLRLQEIDRFIENFDQIAA